MVVRLCELFLIVILISFSSNSTSSSVSNEDKQDTDMPAERVTRVIGDVFSGVMKTVKSFFTVKTNKKKHRKTAIVEYVEGLQRQKDARRPAVIKSYEPEPDMYTSYLAKKKFTLKSNASVEEMITGHGYSSETHTVVTDDGYILTLHRVLVDSNRYTGKKRVVLLHHGLFGSSEDWLIIGQFRSLPYMLTESGFDVWMLNARGNKYSKIHTWKNNAHQDYWNFSFHDIGTKDLPAAIKYVAEYTNKAEMHYIGHSLGCTALLVLLSTKPEYNLMLKSGILLAPLAFMFHAKGPIQLLADFYRRNGDTSLHFLGQTEFFPDGTFPAQMIDKYCKGSVRTCSNPLLLLCNGGRETMSDQLMEQVTNHVPSGGSVKTLIHYVQLVKDGFFRNYDYGHEGNLIVYGNVSVPMYRLERVSLPLSLFSAPSDWLSTVTDIATLISLVKNVKVHHIINAEDFGHLEFLWSIDAPDLVYNFVLSTLDKTVEEFLKEHGDI